MGAEIVGGDRRWRVSGSKFVMRSGELQLVMRLASIPRRGRERRCEAAREGSHGVGEAGSRRDTVLRQPRDRNRQQRRKKPGKADALKEPSPTPPVPKLTSVVSPENHSSISAERAEARRYRPAHVDPVHVAPDERREHDRQQADRRGSESRARCGRVSLLSLQPQRQQDDVAEEITA